MPTIPLVSPAGYAPKFAIAFGNATGGAETVQPDNPLPVTVQPGAAPAAIAGSTSASTTVGPFVPTANRPMVLTLSGAWTGQVQVLRSTDGGVTKLPLTAGGLPYALFTANACETVWEETEAAASIYLAITISSGTVAYRVGQ